MNSSIRDIIKEARLLIEDDKIIKVIDLLNKVPEFKTSFQNALILLKNNLNVLNMDYKIGLINRDSYAMQKIRICNTLLLALDEIETNSGSLQKVTKNLETNYKRKVRFKKEIVKLVILFFSILLLFTYSYFSKDDNCLEYYQRGNFIQSKECYESFLWLKKSENQEKNYKNSKFIVYGNEAFTKCNFKLAQSHYKVVDQKIRDKHLSENLEVIKMVENFEVIKVVLKKYNDSVPSKNTRKNSNDISNI